MSSATQFQEIDREKLYTTLSTVSSISSSFININPLEIRYVSGFIDFDASDITAIKDSASLIAPLVPTIVDAVYERLFSFDITKCFNMSYGTMASKGGGELPQGLDGKPRPDQVSQRPFIKYLVKLVTAEYDDKFIKYLDHVGQIHTDTPDKKSRINVEYIHVNAWLHGFLAQRRAKVLSAFSKLLWIQNDLFAKWIERWRGEMMQEQQQQMNQLGMGLLVGVVVGFSLFIVHLTVELTDDAVIEFETRLPRGKDMLGGLREVTL
ncbi:Protoglobin-domain-containing protein [Chytridium lagenaria]|nr:Protoglobin-domain-containing protein [Chytridium lagenaria]